MPVVNLKPRETRLFENEQKSRFSPVGVQSGLILGVGKAAVITFSADDDGLVDGSITRHNNMGPSISALRLIDDVSVIDNGTYTLENDGVVNPVAQLAVVLIDADDSITNYAVTINGTDAADGSISDVLTFTVGGEVQFTANGPYKTVTSITAGPITGTFIANDRLRVGPRLADAAYELCTRASDPMLLNNVTQDSAQGGSGDDGAYIEADVTSDQEARFSFPAFPDEVTDIVSLTLRFNSKNLAASADGSISDVLTFTVGGEVQFTANGPYKTVTSITAGPITGTFIANDRLRVGPRLADAAYELCTRASDPMLLNNVTQDSAQGGSGDDGAYIEADVTSDQEARFSFPAFPDEVTDIVSLTLRFNSKNLAASAAGGIDYIVRHTGVSYIIGNNSAVDTPTSPSEDSGVIVLSNAPGTGNPWTLAQLNTLEVGCIMLGDSPAVQKQFMRARTEISCRTLPTNVNALVTVEEQFVEAVGGDPFDEGATDDNKYLNSWGGASAAISYNYPSLPTEAIGVLNVKAFWRAAQVSEGHPNGAQDNTYHCAIGGLDLAGTPSVQPRGGTGRHYGQGPEAHSGLGGWKPQADSTGGTEETFGDNGTSRVHNGPGAPEGGCVSGGSSFEVEGRNLPWGTYVNFSELMAGTPGIGAPWSVTNWEGLQLKFEDAGIDDLYRYSKQYAEPEWQRSPNGSPFLHLVVDDDVDAPNDNEFFESQHPDNKKVGCDFNRIPEVTKVNSVTGIMRARKNIGAQAGWRMIWRLGSDAGSDVTEPIQNNDSFSTERFGRTLSPFTGLEWTRDEVNNTVMIFEAQGENAYFGKRVSVMNLEVVTTHGLDERFRRM